MPPVQIAGTESPVPPYRVKARLNTTLSFANAPMAGVKRDRRVVRREIVASQAVHDEEEDVRLRRRGPSAGGVIAPPKWMKSTSIGATATC